MNLQHNHFERFNFFDAILECIDNINTSVMNDQVTKEEMAESTKARMSLIISKLIEGNVWGDAMFMTGWELEDAVPDP